MDSHKKEQCNKAIYHSMVGVDGGGNRCPAKL